MADVRFYWQETGVALYALVHRLSDNKVWDVAGDWATYAVADLDDYDIACSETPAASYWYQFTVPADADFTAGRYHVAVFRQAGGSPAVADLLVAEGDLYWDGSAIAEPLHTGNAPTIGTGAITVDHNTGGADNLAAKTAGGAGIDNVTIEAYLKSDYDAGNHSSAYLKGQTTTDVNGQWATVMKLDAATYTCLFYKQGSYNPTTKEVAVS